jgi:hypothetical protein
MEKAPRHRHGRGSQDRVVAIGKMSSGTVKSRQILPRRKGVLVYIHIIHIYSMAYAAPSPNPSAIGRGLHTILSSAVFFLSFERLSRLL